VQSMTWFVHAVFITGCATLVGAVASIVLIFVKRWALARLVAKRATLLAIVVLGLAVAELQVLSSAPALIAPLLVQVLPSGDPSVKARALAEGISAIMNCAALAIPAALLGAIAWVVARRQLKRSAAAKGS
jgi:hypothetical protein